MTSSRLALYARTAARLRPPQVAHRARLRGQRAALRRWPEAGARLLAGPAAAAATGWPEGYRPVDARLCECWPGLAELQAGKITLLGVTRDLGDPPGWEHADAPRLWRFHLHYWDWAWGLAAAADRPAARALFARLWRSWQECARPGDGAAWLPYPAALRAWSWCGQYRELVAGTGAEREFTAALAAHAGFLRRHLEYDVGGNHLIKGLKAVAGLAVFLADERLLRLALRRLARQAAIQVLPDGGHYERAPAYHCQVLADLIDVTELLAAAGREPEPELTATVSRMRQWLAAVLDPCGQVPLLNDGYPVARELLRQLRPGPAVDGPLLVLPDSGLVRATAGDWQVLSDVGPPCPRGLPAHAHADTFGCLLHVAGEPLLVDTGTSGYEPGPVREYERSTAAHSTVTVDGADSTEVWGAFRAARRARVHGLTARAAAAGASSAGISWQAGHDGYRRLPGRPRHRRRWSLTSSGLYVSDLITGSGRHEIVVRWHLAPGCEARVRGGTALVTAPGGNFTVTFAGAGPQAVTAGSAPVAAGFGVTADAPVLACTVTAELPVSLATVWRRAGQGRGAA